MASALAKQLPWPLGHLLGFALVDEPDVATAKGFPTSMWDFIPVVVGVIPKALLAFVVWNVQYESLIASAKTFELDWMLRVLMRNIVGTLLICCSWDWFLYFSPWKKSLEPFKYNKVYPGYDQLSRDVTYTLSSSFFASLLECYALHGFATGKLGTDSDLFTTKNIMLSVFVTFWRIPHFHFIHRGMHPWRTTSIPDLGYYLYKYVHSLHHKSYNPTSFSGTSMHPVEGFSYYTASFLPWLCFSSCHPYVFLLCHFDLAIGAWLGHDGFQYPGSGNYFHQLHHQYFEINYGDTIVPLDWLFGTFGTKPPKFVNMDNINIKDENAKKNG